MPSTRPCQKSITYIGNTTTSLSIRLACYFLKQSVINKNLLKHNLQELSRKIVGRKTNIIFRSHSRTQHIIREALLLKYQPPAINLKLFSSGDGVLQVF